MATISPEPDVQPSHQDNTLSNHLVGSMVTETGRDMENMFGATADEAIHQDLSNQHQQEGVQDEGSWRQSVLHPQKRKDSANGYNLTCINVWWKRMERDAASQAKM